MELYADKLCFVVYSPAIVLQTLLQNGKQTTTKKPVVNKRRQCESIRFAKVKEKKIERLRLSQGTKNSVSTPRLLKNRIKRGKGEKKKKKRQRSSQKVKKKKTIQNFRNRQMRVTHFSLSRENRKKGELQVKQAEEKKGEDKLFGAFSFSPFPSCF